MNTIHYYNALNCGTTMLHRIDPSLALTEALLPVSQHLQRHGHSACLVPQDMTMQCPDTLIISQEAEDHVARARHVDGIFADWIDQIEWTAARWHCVKWVVCIVAVFALV